METKTSKTSKKSNCYHCDICDYTCFKKYNWDRHIETIKHKKKMETRVSVLETTKSILETNKGFVCSICRKCYKSKSGAYKHIKKCLSLHKKTQKNARFLETKTSKTSNFDDNNGNFLQKNDNNHNFLQKNDKDSFYRKIIEEKDEMLKECHNTIAKTNEKLMEIIENGGQGMGHHNTINSNNTITVNMFLTEHCKDAMFLDDFVKNIKIRLQDVMDGDCLEDNAISNVIVQKLEDLEPTKRPIHCTDPKRKKFVVNDKREGWIKDSLKQSNSKLKDGLEDLQRNAFINVYDEFDQKYKPPHEDRLEKKKSAIVGCLRNPLITGKGTEKIVKNITEVSNIKEAIKSLKDNT